MPLSPERIVRYDRLVTPREHLGVLVEPAGDRVRSLLKSPGETAFSQQRLLDESLTAVRARLREQLGLTGPVILSGHQPEFMHAGVFAKTIAAHVLVQELGGTAVFLMVDSDVTKTARLAVPQNTMGGLRRIEITIPDRDPQRPFEFETLSAREQWLQFFAGTGSMYEFRDQSLLPTFARAWLTTHDTRPTYCDAFARALAATEVELGLAGVRSLTVSRLCATPAFRAFLARMALDAASCATHYNAALITFRQRHRIRARGRPVPRLVVSGQAVELPCWVLRPNEPRRRLFVTTHDELIELATDNRVIAEIRRADLRQSAFHAEPWPLERAGWCIRPRALALSAFVRLCLADLFIHGIGGAKYDEMMEDFLRRWLGIDPAPACCVSATARLPLEAKGVRLADIAAARQQSRDLHYNPQRHLPNVPVELARRREELVRRSAELRAHHPRDHAGRRLVFRELRRLNEQILAADPWRTAEYDQRIGALEAQWGHDQIALDREYFYALHPRATLEKLVRVIRGALRSS